MGTYMYFRQNCGGAPTLWLTLPWKRHERSFCRETNMLKANSRYFHTPGMTDFIHGNNNEIHDLFTVFSRQSFPWNCPELNISRQNDLSCRFHVKLVIVPARLGRHVPPVPPPLSYTTVKTSWNLQWKFTWHCTCVIHIDRPTLKCPEKNIFTRRQHAFLVFAMIWCPIAEFYMTFSHKGMNVCPICKVSLIATIPNLVWFQ